jgi:hypothetical protein
MIIKLEINLSKGEIELPSFKECRFFDSAQKFKFLTNREVLRI